MGAFWWVFTSGLHYKVCHGQRRGGGGERVAREVGCHGEVSHPLEGRIWMNLVDFRVCQHFVNHSEMAFVFFIASS